MFTKLRTVASISRTKPLSPSKLGSVSQCSLRYLLETERPREFATSIQPLVIRGTAIHKIIERHTGDHTVRGGQLGEELLVELTKAIERLSDISLVRWAHACYGIDGIFSTSQLVSGARFAFKVIGNLPEARREPDTKVGEPGRSRMENTLGSERRFSAPELELAGIVDLTYKHSDGTVRVVDFKSGSLLDEQRNIKAMYRIQIIAYGVMVKRALGVDKVSLQLEGPSGSWITPLDLYMEREIKAICSDISQSLPLGRWFNATEIATLGSHCSQCPYRKYCQKYVELLRSGAAANSEVVSLQDAYGRVSAVELIGKLMKFRIRRQDGSFVSINGIPIGLGNAPPVVGATLAGFDLGPLEVVRTGGLVSNFVVIRKDNVQQSAFAAEIFSDEI